jgi:dienelactone hydrolase
MTPQRRIAAALLALLAGCAFATCKAQDSELTRSFDLGRVEFKSDGALQSRRIADAMPLLRTLDRSAFRGTVVYLHGCDGINLLSTRTADMLAAEGYLVFLPDSFARRDKPVSCEPAEFRGSLHRDVLGWRQAEAGYALKQVKTLPAVDAGRLFLMGLSEGAITVATYRGEAVAGRVIEGWTCHAEWPEYRGLNAPEKEPVLALSSQDDPWFQASALRGDCGEFMAPRSPLRRSIVFRPPHPAASQHDLMWNKEARQLVLDFLSGEPPGCATELLPVSKTPC